MTSTLKTMLAFAAPLLFATALQAKTLESTLVPLFVDEKSDIGNMDVRTAAVVIDTQKKVISVTFYRAQGVACMAIGCPKPITPKPYHLELPLLSIQPDNCQATVYSGTIVSPLVGGGRHEVRITDNSTNKCMTFVALNPVELDYLYSNASSRIDRSESRFISDEKLVRTK